ncbi:MAG: protein phosphatase 2C domain-containing protein, partial [Bacilli bacterium]|nr:protein phosphatase 2C domain-containing protein [Bacilli bacterium]
MKYYPIVHTYQGAAHIQKGNPCEDHGMIVDEGDYKIFATCDGHGQEESMRSRLGSYYLCDIVQDELKRFYKKIKAISGPHNPLEVLGEENVRPLIANIINRWNERVLMDYHLHPLSEEEWQKAGKKADEYKRGVRLNRIYGTTLLCGLFDKDFALFIHQGDGLIMLVSHDGSSTYAVEPDPRCTGNVSTSVCGSDAINEARFNVIDMHKDPFIAVFAGSDGVDDSYHGKESLDYFYHSIIKMFKDEGYVGLNGYLANRLPEVSRLGSGDDITVTGYIRDPDTIPLELITYYDCSDQLIALKDQLERANDKLISMDRKYKYQLALAVEGGEKLNRCESIFLELLKEQEELSKRIEEKREYLKKNAVNPFSLRVIGLKDSIRKDNERLRQITVKIEQISDELDTLENKYGQTIDNFENKTQIEFDKNQRIAKENPAKIKEAEEKANKMKAALKNIDLLVKIDGFEVIEEAPKYRDMPEMAEPIIPQAGQIYLEHELPSTSEEIVEEPKAKEEAVSEETAPEASEEPMAEEAKEEAVSEEAAPEAS